MGYRGRFSISREDLVRSHGYEKIHEDKNCVVYGNTDKPRYSALAFHGKADRPDFHYSFATKEARDRKILDYAAGQMIRADTRAFQRAHRQISGHAATAAAIRKDLKTAFPDTVFQVRSDCFAGGDSVSINWTDGPASQVVELLVGKYQRGHFDGMTDMYEYSNRRDDIPQVKYVQTQRRHSAELARKIAAELNSRYGYEIKIRDSKYDGWSPEPQYIGMESIHDLIYRAIQDHGREEAAARQKTA